MKLSLLFLASLVESEFPDSACDTSNISIDNCSTSCDSKSIGNKVIKRYLYGENSWLYSVYGTEKLTKDQAKESYRNVVFFSEKKCGTSTLLSLHDRLKSGDVRLESLDRSDKMMKLEHFYANFETDTDCSKNDRGLWIQVKRDAEFRESDLMNKKKTRDSYYLHVQNVSGFGESADLESINKCLKSGNVYRMKENVDDDTSDMTKCMSYKKCEKDLDWGSFGQQDSTQPVTIQPVTPPSDIDWSTIPPPDLDFDFNNLDYEIECESSDEVEEGYKKCILKAGDFIFYGRLNQKKKVVQFTLKYADIPARWQASTLNYQLVQGIKDNLILDKVQCPELKEKGETNPDLIDYDGEEDCLFLSISVKKSTLDNKEKIPVLFNIHGGGYNSGTGTGYNHHSVLHQDVVRVSTNYRLGALGFLYLDEVEDGQEYQGNWGLLDQQNALKWFYSFAGIFGGNRDQITLTGFSSGGESVWRQFMIPKSWPYFKRIAPTGLGLTLGTRGPTRHKEVTKRFFEQANCTVGDLSCLRSLSLEQVIDVYFHEQNNHQAAIAMAFNYRFGPVHRSKLMPDTMFNMVKNRQVRPNTPVLYTYAKDEVWSSGGKDFLLGSPGIGLNKLEDMKNEIKQTIEELENDPETNKVVNPAPYFNTWLRRTFGDFGDAMVDMFGCEASDISGDHIDCQRQTSRLMVSTQWVCAPRYAFKQSYGPEDPMDTFYPVEFAEPNSKDNFGVSNLATHGAQTGYINGKNKKLECTNDQNGEQVCLGKWATEAYGEFYQTGKISANKDYSLKTFAELNFEDFNQISNKNWGDFGTRNEDCDLLDQVHEQFNWYNWGITNDGEESINEKSWNPVK